MSQAEEVREDILDKEYIMSKSTNVGGFGHSLVSVFGSILEMLLKKFNSISEELKCKEKYILNLVGTEEWVRM